MEEKKSSNQVIEKFERNFQFFDGVTENAIYSKLKHYGRDLLLQLRLHPLSLQKPEDLPGLEVVKEKLYLDDINETYSTSTDKNLNNCHASSKPECYNMKSEYSMLPHYLNKLYPYCFPPYAYNGAYQNLSSKFRSSYHTYCNSLKKHCAAGHQCYKDFPMEECLWAKRCFTSSEDMWNCYPNHVPSNFAMKKENLEAVPKIRKKLAIIDPATGKNILEVGANINQDQQSDSYAVQENSESSESFPAVNNKENNDGDYFCNAEVSEIPSFTLSNEDETEMSTIESMSEQENMHDLIKNPENIDKNCDTSKLPTKKELKRYQNMEKELSVKCNCQSHHEKDCNVHACKENGSKSGDTMKEGLKQLKDKPYSLKQEQQKMAILQSFLRFKKYQLEENARNLDEKKIEIANWECNLFNKAKKLYNKEIWLESKSEILYMKAQQLAEREKMLSKEGKSGDCSSSKSIPKNTQLLEKKSASYNCNDTTWDEIPTKIKGSCRNNDSSVYSYFGYASNSNKIPGDLLPNVEKCKSDASSFNELEKNIVFIEEMHLGSEAGDTNLENKTESSSSNTIQKKSEDDSIGYSKGRRYMPEHIKYWLNKREKSGL